MSENTISKIKIKDIEYELGTTIDNVSGLQDILNSKSNTDHVHGVATTTTAGFMSAADKVKLDALNGSGGGEGGSVNIDTTLSVAGFAADAKAAGDALANKQDKLTFDTTPTSGSTNPVTSGGLFSEFATQGEKIEMANMIANMAMPGSLKWDGYVGDRECVIFSEEIGEGLTTRVEFVHVSDYMPELFLLISGETPAEERILTVLCSISGAAFSGVNKVEEMQVQVADDMSIISEAFFYIPTDGYSVEGSTFPKKGWYFLSYTYCMGDIEVPTAYVSGLKLDTITFPDSNGGGKADKYFESVSETVEVIDTSVGDTLTWDGVIDNRDFFIAEEFGKNAYFVRVGDIDCEVDYDYLYENRKEISGSYFSVSQDEIVSVESAYNTTDISDDIINITVIQIHAQAWIVLSDNATAPDLPFVFPKAGVYFEMIDGYYLTSLTVPNYKFVAVSNAIETHEVIKTEHLPKALQFGEFTETIGTDTLEWDGDTTGLVNVAVGTLTVYKVSDVVLRPTDITGDITVMSILENQQQQVATSKDEFVFSADEVLKCFKDDGFGNLSSILSVPYNGYIYDNEGVEVVFPESGIYFLCIVDGEVKSYIKSITIPGYTGFNTKEVTTIKKIDQKYLPDSLQFGEVEKPGVDTLTWDGNIEGRVVVEEKVTIVTPVTYKHVKISEVIPTINDFKNGVSFVTNTEGVDSQFTITFEDFDGVLNIAANDGFVHLFNGAVVVPADNYAYGDVIFPEAGTYLSILIAENPSADEDGDGVRTTVMKSITLPGYTGFGVTTEVIKIDEKYLPEALQFGEMPTGGDTLTWDGNTEGLETLEAIDLPGFYRVSDFCDLDTITKGFSVTLFNDAYIEIPSTECSYNKDDGTLIAAGGIAGAIIPDVEEFVTAGVIPGLYLSRFSDSAYYSSITIPGYTGFPSVKKIDEKYLPESATIQSDWNQTDETAPDFLKNKPFGDVPTVILEEQELAVDFEQGACMAPVSGQIKEDDYLSIVFDGVVYETKVIGINGNIVFGNTELAGVGGGNGEPFFGMFMEGVVVIVPMDQSAANHTVKISLLVVTKIPAKYYNTRAMFYSTNGMNSYLYKDTSCTIKATKADVEAVADKYSIVVSFQGLYYIAPFYVDLTNSYATLVVAIVDSKGNLVHGPLYTAEYTG